MNRTFVNGEGDSVELDIKHDVLHVRVQLKNTAPCELRVRGAEVNTVIHAMRNRAFLRALPAAESAVADDLERAWLSNRASVRRLIRMSRPALRERAVSFARRCWSRLPGVSR